MNTIEANNAAQHLLGLFPSLSAEQVVEWAAEFEKHDVQSVREACQRHYSESTDGFVKPKLLREMIDTEERRTAHGQRLSDSRREAEERRSAIEREYLGAQEQYGSVDRQLAGLSDSDLEELRAAVIHEKPGLESFLKRGNLKTGKISRALMADHLRRASSGSRAR